MFVALFALILITSPDDLALEQDQKCDNGEAPWSDDGEPNWRCTKNGCPPTETLCWPEATIGCYDTDDNLLDFCSVKDNETCDTPFDCFALWWTCHGTYKCYEDETCECIVKHDSPIPSQDETAPASELVCAFVEPSSAWSKNEQAGSSQPWRDLRHTVALVGGLQ